MNKEVTILLAEDNDGHSTLIKRNLKRAGIENEIKVFKEGEEVLNFLFQKGDGETREPGHPYLLLLDIKMSKIDGVEVLRRIKEDDELKKIPVIMVTTTDDPREIDKCHSLGCSSYLTKSINPEQFINSIKQLGLYLMVIEIPKLDGGI